MKCDFCDQKATVFLTQLVEGQMKKVSLCDACAKERGVTDPTGFSLVDLLLGGLPAGAGKQAAPGKSQPSPADAAKKCPTCGFSLDDLRRVRRFGCGDCYAAFSDEVSQVVRGLHQGTSHVGKVPAGLMAQHIRHQRIEELRSRLEQSISAENYEEAAGIRDEMLVLTKNLTH